MFPIYVSLLSTDNFTLGEGLCSHNHGPVKIFIERSGIAKGIRVYSPSSGLVSQYPVGMGPEYEVNMSSTCMKEGDSVKFTSFNIVYPVVGGI